jgi:hypothetical protein
MEKLEEALRLLQVLETVRAQVAKVRVSRESLLHQGGSGLRQENLSSVRGSEEARHPVQRRSEVVATAWLDHAGVEGHPHPEGADLPPLLPEYGALGIEGSGDGCGSGGKSGADLVAHALEDTTAVGLDGAMHKDIVARERRFHRRSMLLPEPGAALDVGEEKGNGAGWELGGGVHSRDLRKVL